MIADMEKTPMFREECEKLENQLQTCQHKLEELKKEIQLAAAELKLLQGEILAEAGNFVEYENLDSGDYKKRHALLKREQKHLTKEGKAVVIAGDSGSNGKTLFSISKQILRCFNQECDSLIWTISSKNSDSTRIKILKSFAHLNHIFAVSGVALSEELLKMKLEELNLIHAYRIKLDNEKAERILFKQRKRNEAG